MADSHQKGLNNKTSDLKILSYMQPYKEQILEGIQLLLSSQDRDPTSPTFGCYDREYWAWATKEYSNIDLQRGVFACAFLWSTNFDGNPYYKSDRLLKWIIAGIRFWCKQQHKDGSFDHLYPNEHSFIGVGFTLFEVCKAFEIIKNRLSRDQRSLFIYHMGRAGDFLVDHDESHGFISNHRAGSACGLFLLHKVTGNQRYLKQANDLIDGIAKKQSDEGWLFEYCGSDPGYQTLDTHYLAQYYEMSKDSRVLKMLCRSIEFISKFVQPDGTIGGEYGSRVTELYYPGGFEIMARYDENAYAISAFMRHSIARRGCVHLLSVDIRNFVPFLSSYCVAISAVLFGRPDHVPCKLAFEKQESNYFPKAGLMSVCTKRFFVVVGISRGVVRVYEKDQLVYCNSGYFGELKERNWHGMQKSKGTRVSTQMAESATNVGVSPTGRIPFEIRCTLRFYKVPLRTMTQFRFVLFRLFNLTAGRFYRINNIVRQYFIVPFFIAPKPRPMMRVDRRIKISEDLVSITDEIDSCGKRFLSLFVYPKFTTIFMASARYFQTSELKYRGVEPVNLAEEINRNGRMTVKESVGQAEKD